MYSDNSYTFQSSTGERLTFSGYSDKFHSDIENLRTLIGYGTDNILTTGLILGYQTTSIGNLSQKITFTRANTRLSQMNPYLVTAILDFALCAYVLLTQPKAPAATAFMSFCLGIWSLELFSLSYISNIEILTPIFHLTRWGMLFMPAALVFLTFQLVKEKMGAYVQFALLPCFIMSFGLSIANTFFFPSELQPANSGYLPEKDLIYTAFIVELLYATIATLAQSIIIFSSANKRDKQKIIWWIILGTIIFGLAIGIAMVFLTLNRNYLSNFLGTYPNLAYITCILYITNNKNPKDLKKSLSIIATNTLVITIILSTYFYLGSLTGIFTPSASNIIISSIILVPAILFYSKITRYGVTSISRLFAKHSYDKDTIIREFNEAFRNTNSIQELSKKVETLFLCIIRVKKVEFHKAPSKNAKTDLGSDNSTPEQHTEPNPCISYAETHDLLFFSDEVPPNVSTYMRKRNLEAILPITTNNQLAYIICIGEPRTYKFFENEDIVLFGWLQTELSNAIIRIEKLKNMKNELNESRKTLSMLEVMNQYHHDIKTPLAVIDGIVSTDIYDKDLQREIVMEQVTRGTKLIATMAEILRGKRNREIKKLRLQDNIQQCLLLFDNHFEKITTDCRDEQKILGDDIDLKILFSNILKNASEAIDPTRALTLHVKTWNDEKHVYISITDSGIGIPSDTIENLWALEKSEKASGNAIGLQAVKRITEEHKAHISVSSVVGTGTTFELKFPISLG